MLIATSIVRNEAGRYLSSWLENVRTYADLHLVLDDASDDDTVAMLRARQAVDPALVVECGSQSLFAGEEQRLRARLWDLTRAAARAGDWILVVDADEFYDGELPERKQRILARPERLVRFRHLDLWTESRYRVDGYWSASFHRLFRYEDQPFGPVDAGLNRSPLPEYARRIEQQGRRRAIYRSGVRCLHKGWLGEAERRRKVEFYLAHLDESFGLAHVRSAVDGSPRLATYREDHRSLAERGSRALLATRESIGELLLPARRFAAAGVRRALGPAWSSALRGVVGKER